MEAQLQMAKYVSRIMKSISSVLKEEIRNDGSILTASYTSPSDVYKLLSDELDHPVILLPLLISIDSTPDGCVIKSKL